ncbi:MAG: hypothetical protein B7Y25_08530 [Alphaproteobacteria bacterium 16-39-46]|nr:MAG: hypothetical protein B7Y25_08530 [Alphaproteobacteria bacterium 16-39-46]OZA40998.1 MAG: hypothetical protein B7X84_08725 [Alphaproteobacteria bacterium 17-39-52]HQS84993.1 hypothetical protein [Alphaproteobacteria bacterium]HQS94735.1 hypothetical protein [Alphaproteobacteria bacterium]
MKKPLRTLLTLCSGLFFPVNIFALDILEEGKFTVTVGLQKLPPISCHLSKKEIPAYLMFENSGELEAWIKSKLKIAENTSALSPLLINLTCSQLPLPVCYIMTDTQVDFASLGHLEDWILKTETVVDFKKRSSLKKSPIRYSDRELFNQQETFNFIFSYTKTRALAYFQKGHNALSYGEKKSCYEEAQRSLHYFDCHDFIALPPEATYPEFIHSCLMDLNQLALNISVSRLNLDYEGILRENLARFILQKYTSQEQIERHFNGKEALDFSEIYERITYYYGLLYRLGRTPESYKGMRDYVEKLKSKDPFFCKKAQAYFQCFQPPENPSSRRHFLRIQQDFRKETDRLKSWSETYPGNSNKNDLQLRLLHHEIIQKLDFLTPETDQSYFRDVIKKIKELETFIFCHYFEMAKEHEQDVQDNIEVYVHHYLKDIYKCYFDVVSDSEIFKNVFIFYLMSFIQAGDLEGAFDRLVSNEDLLTEIFPDSQDIDLLKASIENMMGNPEKLCTLITEQELRKRKSQTAKGQKKINLIRGALAHQEEKEPSSGEGPLKSKSSQPRIVPSCPPLSPVASETFKSIKEEKEEKQRRHHENIEKRRLAYEKQAAASDEKAPLSQGGTKEISPPEKKREDDFRAMADIYPLKTSSRKVDQAIEKETWDFTREKFEHYLKDLGCTPRRGSGSSHEVYETPKSVAYENDAGVLITVLTTEDFGISGGAIILPPWEKSVPFYLRKQLRSVREKLRQLGIAFQDKITSSLN